EMLVERIENDPHYITAAKVPGPDPKEPPFTKQFTVQLGVVKQGPEHYKDRFTPPAPPQLAKAGRQGPGRENLPSDANVEGIAKPQRGEQVRHGGLPSRGPARGGIAARDTANALNPPPGATPIGAAPVEFGQQIKMAAEAGNNAPARLGTTNPAVEAARKH